MHETHDAFMVRIREMSSATHKPSMPVPNRATSSSKQKAVWTGRREKKAEIVSLYRLGKSDEEIADDLGMSVDSVKSLRMMKL